MLVCNSAKWLKNKLIFQNGYITQHEAVISMELMEMISPVQFNHLIIIKMNCGKTKLLLKKQWVSGCILNNFFFFLSSNMQIHHSLVCILLINILIVTLGSNGIIYLQDRTLVKNTSGDHCLCFIFSLESGSVWPSVSLVTYRINQQQRYLIHRKNEKSHRNYFKRIITYVLKYNVWNMLFVSNKHSHVCVIWFWCMSSCGCL